MCGRLLPITGQGSARGRRGLREDSAPACTTGSAFMRRQIHSDNELVRMIVAETREVLRASAEVLDQPKPGTFLGTKTQEPFPKGKTD